MDGAVTFGLGLCGNYLAGGLDGLAGRRAEGGVDGGFDFGIDGGTVCTGAADHARYEPDVLGDGGDGLFGGGGVGCEVEGFWLFVFSLHGIWIFGEGPDGLGGTAIGGMDLGVVGKKERGKADSSLEKWDGADVRGGVELVCGGLPEVS